MPVLRTDGELSKDIFASWEISSRFIHIASFHLSDENEISFQSPLIGDNSLNASIVLVRICFGLEGKSKSEQFSFDWISEKVMSSLKNVFKSPETFL